MKKVIGVMVTGLVVLAFAGMAHSFDLGKIKDAAKQAAPSDAIGDSGEAEMTVVNAAQQECKKIAAKYDDQRDKYTSLNVPKELNSNSKLKLLETKVDWNKPSAKGNDVQDKRWIAHYTYQAPYIGDTKVRLEMRCDKDLCYAQCSSY